MYVESAFALTPAAIIRLANVCRHSWSPIASRPAFSHRRFVRSARLDGENGEVAVRPNTSPVRRPELIWCARRYRRSSDATGTRRTPERLLGVISPTFASHERHT